MKLGLFSDPHYSSHELTCGVRRNSLSLKKINDALAYFRQQGCDLVICLGDLIDREDDHEKEIMHLSRIACTVEQSGVPFISLMGNHDAFALTEKEFYSVLGEKARPHPLKLGEITLIFLDACHFATGVHYAPGDDDWTDTFYPYTEDLKLQLQKAKGEVIVLMHQNIDPDIHVSHCLSNAAEIRKVLEESGKVRRVVQGHYHPGAQNVVNGIRYLTLPAMCENEKTNSLHIMQL